MLPRYVTSDTIQQELDARVFFPNSTIVLLRWLMVTAVLMGAVAAIVASAGLNLAVSWATLDINCIRLIKSTTPIVSLVYVLAPLTAVIEGVLATINTCPSFPLLVCAVVFKGIASLRSRALARLFLCAMLIE